MAGLSAFNEGTVLNVCLERNHGDGTNQAEFGSPSKSSWRIDAILATNSDAVEHNCWLLIANDGPTARIGQAVIPAGAGFGTTGAVDLLALMLPEGLKGVVMGGRDLFRVALVEETAADTAVQLWFMGASI